MNIAEKFDDNERKLTETMFAPHIDTDNINEKIKDLQKNQDTIIGYLLDTQKNLKSERDELYKQLFQLQQEIYQLKNKNKSKKIKYGLVGILSFATIFSAIILPDFLKLLSIGFICPLVNQLYYLFRDR